MNERGVGGGDIYSLLSGGRRNDGRAAGGTDHGIVSDSRKEDQDKTQQVNDDEHRFFQFNIHP